MHVLAAPAIDTATRRWIRDASDERAAREGCRFDETRAQFVVDWIHKYLKLYEGEHAGEVMELRDWQLEATMRIFGWVRHSEQWGREVRRFRRASIWVPKKNKKSPTLAAWGLYLLAGDSEPGQKVFLAAKDGNQARDIAGKHAFEMLAQSGDLDAECTTNKNLYQITHEPTRSIMRPLSSGAERNQRAKEGLNGSVLIDETHVVDEEFIGIISRAGISRSEPLQIEVSTAGDNPDGYGKKQFDKAVAIIRGDQYQRDFFALVYAAPQDLKDADLDADPIKYGKMANPAWGHTVDPEEFLSDYQNSKHSLTELGRFKMYRLNIWQQSCNPWIRMSDWDECRTDFDLEKLEGRECWAGLDLSLSRDMSALVLVFPWEGDTFRVVPFFWLPEDEAREKNHLAPFLQWAHDGYLELTPGNEIDFGFIRKRFGELFQRFCILDLLYDKTYATDFTQQLQEEVGVQRTIFPQTTMFYTGPAKMFESLVKTHKLQHQGHPILTWQVGHVQVYRDANDNIRPMKDKNNLWKKIDGVAAGVMALAGAMQGNKVPELITL